MNLQEKIVAYVRKHGGERGRTSVTLAGLIWGLQDAHPQDPRPTVGQVHTALTELNAGEDLIVERFFEVIILRSPRPPVEVQRPSTDTFSGYS